MNKIDKNIRKLMWFPIITMIVSLLVLIFFVYPIFEYGLTDPLPPSAKWVIILIMFLSLFSILLGSKILTRWKKN
jgi:type VI protein secretion system component VasK